MAIDDPSFAALVTLIEDGELDDRMVDLIAVIDQRNERRKHEILRLVQSIWGPDANVVGGTPPRESVNASPTNEPAPPGYYRAMDGQFYPVPQTPTLNPTPEVDPAPSRPGNWPAPIESASLGGGLGVSPVRDPMSAGGDLGDSDPNIVSTGAQIERYTSG